MENKIVLKSATHSNREPQNVFDDIDIQIEQLVIDSNISADNVSMIKIKAMTVKIVNNVNDNGTMKTKS